MKEIPQELINYLLTDTIINGEKTLDNRNAALYAFFNFDCQKCGKVKREEYDGVLCESCGETY